MDGVELMSDPATRPSVLTDKDREEIKRLMRNAVDDVADDTMNSMTFHNWAQFIISMSLLVGSFGFLFLVFFSGLQVAPEHKESLLQVTGSIVTLIGGVSGFWIGTSLSSKLKDRGIPNA